MLRVAWLFLACLLAGSALASVGVEFEVEWLGEGALVDGPPTLVAAAPELLEPGLIRDFGAGGWWRIRPAGPHEDNGLPSVLYFVGGYAATISIWLPGETTPSVRSRFSHRGQRWGSTRHLPLLVPAGMDLQRGILLHVRDAHGRRARPTLAALDHYALDHFLTAATRSKIVPAILISIYSNVHWGLAASNPRYPKA